MIKSFKLRLNFGVLAVKFQSFSLNFGELLELTKGNAISEISNNESHIEPIVKVKTQSGLKTVHRGDYVVSQDGAIDVFPSKLFQRIYEEI